MHKNEFKNGILSKSGQMQLRERERESVRIRLQISRFRPCWPSSVRTRKLLESALLKYAIYRTQALYVHLFLYNLALYSGCIARYTSELCNIVQNIIESFDRAPGLSARHVAAQNIILWLRLVFFREVLVLILQG